MQEVWNKFENLQRDMDAGIKTFEDALNKERNGLTSLRRDLASDWMKVSSTIDQRANGLIQKTNAAKPTLQQHISGLRADLQKKLNVRADLKARIAALDTQAGAIDTSIDANLKTATDTISQQLDTARSQVASRKASAEATLDGLDQKLDAAIASGKQQLGTLRDGVVAKYTDLKAQLRDKAQQLDTQIDTLENQVIKTTLDPLPPKVAAAKQTVQTNADTAKQTLNQGLDRVDASIKQIKDALLPPLAQARATIDAADAKIQALVDQADKGMDVVLNDGLAQIKKLLTAFDAFVATSVETLEGLQALIKGFRDTVLPPLDALNEKVADLKQLFDTGISLLQGVLDAAVSTLDAIPATGLPRPLVQGAISAIQSAVSAIAPQIDTASKQASQQLSNMADQLVTQTNTIKTAAVNQIDTFTKTTLTQIDAVMPQVQTQMQTVQTQIETAVAQFVTQIQTIQTQTTTAIQQAKKAVTDAVTQVLDTAATQLETGTNQATALVDGVRTQVATAKNQLLAQVDQLSKTFNDQLANVAKQTDSVLAQVRQAIAQATQAASAQADAFLTPAKAAYDKLSQQLAQSGSVFSTQATQLRTANTNAITQVTAQIPTDAALQTPIDAAVQQLEARITTVRTQLAAL